MTKPTRFELAALLCLTLATCLYTGAIKITVNYEINTPTRPKTQTRCEQVNDLGRVGDLSQEGSP